MNKEKSCAHKCSDFNNKKAVVTFLLYLLCLWHGAKQALQSYLISFLQLILDMDIIRLHDYH